MVIFIDESHKDRKAARRKYGWSLAGTPVNYRALFNMDIRYSLIGVADCFGFVMSACDLVVHKVKEKEEMKPVDSDRFVEFVREKLVSELGNFSRKEPHSVVIMDNYSIHLDPRVRELIEAAGAVLLYSAPYCPELIPIEYFFHLWKSYLKRNYVQFNQNWYPVHLAGLRSVNAQQALNTFKTTLVKMAEEHPLSYESQARASINFDITLAVFFDEIFE
jgi:transposase